MPDATGERINRYEIPREIPDHWTKRVSCAAPPFQSIPMGNNAFAWLRNGF
jgi:hypothetical protein